MKRGPSAADEKAWKFLVKLGGEMVKRARINLKASHAYGTEPAWLPALIHLLGETDDLALSHTYEYNMDGIIILYANRIVM